jgi:hypothetical protein
MGCEVQISAGTPEYVGVAGTLVGGVTVGWGIRASRIMHQG